MWNMTPFITGTVPGKAAPLDRTDRGYTIVEAIAVMAIFGIACAMAFPIFTGSLASMRLDASVRDVQSELQSARLKAVSSNRAMRVRFNCPEVDQFRVVELIGTPSSPDGKDDASDRCDETAYPVLAGTHNPLIIPNNDGPVRRLRQNVKFLLSNTIEFWPDGTAHASTGGVGTWPQVGSTNGNIILQMGTTQKTVTVNAVGKVHIQ